MSVDQILAEYKAIYNGNPLSIIEFYDSKFIFLNNTRQFRDSSELHAYIELTWHYLNAKFQKSYLNELVSLVEKIRSVIDAEITRLNDKNLKDKWYYGILFLYGKANYNLRHYKTASPVFKELLKHDDKNDLYASWLSCSVYAQRQFLIHAIYISGIFITIVPSFIGKKYLPPSVMFVVDGVFLLAILPALGYELYMKRSLKKKKLQ